METGPSGPNKTLEQYVKPIKEKIEEYLRRIFGKKKKTNNQEEDSQNMPSFPGKIGNSGKKKSKGNSSPKTNEELPVEDQDSYIPKDMEFGESEGEQSRFAVVYPFLRGKYATGKLSYFSPSTNLWSKNANCNH